MNSNFEDRPAQFFNYDLTAAHHVPRMETEHLQLEAAQRRFSALRDSIAPLKAMADTQNINSFQNLDDIPATLFPHSFYKAYPERLVAEGNFPLLTQWLSRLTKHDLGAVQANEYHTIDAWMQALEDHTDVILLHSSGTMGRLSFFPHGKVERERIKDFAQMAMGELFAPAKFNPNDPGMAVIWPSYAGGRSAIARAGGTAREAYCSTPDDFYTLIPMEMSADYQNYVIQAEAARQHGQYLSPDPGDYVRPILAQMDELQRTHEQRINVMLDSIENELGSRKVYLTGGPLMVYALAKAGVARGMENAFGPGSVVSTVGGFKGTSPVGDEEQTIKRFAGVSMLHNFYGMTELCSGFLMCPNGRQHCQPWIIPFVLDPRTGAPLPREGVQSGRAAFLDLDAQSYWGGVVSGDHIEMNWSPCGCGRTTPHVNADIKRVTDSEERVHYIGAASEAAVDAALAALAEGLE